MSVDHTYSRGQSALMTTHRDAILFWSDNAASSNNYSHVDSICVASVSFLTIYHKESPRKHGIYFSYIADSTYQNRFYLDFKIPFWAVGLPRL
jgi:hypothetical protein